MIKIVNIRFTYLCLPLLSVVGIAGSVEDLLISGYVRHKKVPYPLPKDVLQSIDFFYRSPLPEKRYEEIFSYFMLHKVALLEQWRKRALQSYFSIDFDRLSRKEGVTPLWKACYHRDNDMMAWLLNKGKADPNIKNRDGEVSLLMASIQVYGLDRVKLLVAHGADLDIQGEDGGTAMMRSALHASFDITLYLLECGARIDLQDHHGRSITSIIDERKEVNRSASMKAIVRYLMKN